jgi:RNA polymerase sigma factor (sigma-70 family)
VARRVSEAARREARRLGLGEDLAEEVAQEIAAVLPGKLQKFQAGEDPEASFRGWLSRVVHNAIISVRRRKGVKADEAPLPLDLDGSATNLASRVRMRLDREVLLARIDQFVASRNNPEHLEFWRMAHAREMSPEEIAAATGRPYGTVVKALYRLRELVKKDPGIRRLARQVDSRLVSESAPAGGPDVDRGLEDHE